MAGKGHEREGYHEPKEEDIEVLIAKWNIFSPAVDGLIQDHGKLVLGEPNSDSHRIYKTREIKIKGKKHSYRMRIRARYDGEGLKDIELPITQVGKSKSQPLIIDRDGPLPSVEALNYALVMVNVLRRAYDTSAQKRPNKK
ncbi:MAG: hypothetical protein ABSE17_04555 [Candidatus Levyibacteriota bacterium]|jgi:hypothetical protein